MVRIEIIYLFGSWIKGSEVVRVIMVAIAGSLWPIRCQRFNNFFSDIVVHLRVRNISCAPIQSICYTCSSLLDL